MLQDSTKTNLFSMWMTIMQLAVFTKDFAGGLIDTIVR